MKILFVLHLFSHTRHFHSVFQELIDRGHSLEVLGLNDEFNQGPTVRPPKHARHISPVIYSRLPDPRSDFWGGYVEAFRASRNLLLYSQKKFQNATIFRDRMLSYADPFLAQISPSSCMQPPLWLKWFYRLVEFGIPPDPVVVRLLDYKRPDVVLVTPLIFFNMIMLNEHVKAANLLGIPIGFPVFSWDNLTTKGTAHDLPDRIFVWNEMQKMEATDFHGWPADRVEVLGAWRFDEFVCLKPRTDRAGFCKLHNFDLSERTILYIGSSPIVAPTEFDFVSEWLKALRTAPSENVRRANVLVRPHPRNLKAWQSVVKLQPFDRVSVESIEGLSLFESQSLYEDIYHSDVVMGLVTSAMIEAALLRKPVHTVMTKLAGEGQEGTVHFDYLRTAGGGLLYVANTFDEHIERLASHLSRPIGTSDERAENFVRAFVNPPSDVSSSTEALADAIERLARLEKRPARFQAIAAIPRWLVKNALKAGILPVKRTKAPRASE